MNFPHCASLAPSPYSTFSHMNFIQSSTPMKKNQKNLMSSSARRASGCHRRVALNKRLTTKRRRSKVVAGRAIAVERKVRKLQKIIPGGEGMLPDRLFLLTADYILHLRLQLNLLQALSKVYSS